jgi:hypothetical protein
MTFILALGNREQFIQISDRRLSWDGKLVDDESNKAGILLCKDARHIFGFTGLAKYEKFNTRQWLLNALYECCPPDYKINRIMPRLMERATRDFQNLPVLKSLEPRRKRLSIMFSGYNYYVDPPMGALGILTNYQNFQTGKDDHEAWDHFEMNCWSEIRPLEHEFTIVQRVGNWTAMTGEDEIALRELLKKLKPHQAIADKAVTLVRKMADRPKAKGTIGKELSVVVLQRDVSQHVLSRYYATTVGPKMFAPDEIVGISDTRRHAHADREIWIESAAGPEPWVIPKVKGNSPCPCKKSGKRYKDCCGRQHSPRQARNPQQSLVARQMIFRGVARWERPKFNDQQLQDWVRQNWVLFARMAYGEYVDKGRGAIFINLAKAVIDDDGIYFDPVYVADNSKELEARGGWPEDKGNKTVNLIATYDPEQVMIFIITREGGRISTMFMGTDDPNFTPKHLYETALETD